ncbi:MAG: hypothetical protein R6X33_11560 [Candidatus Brocadiia bacterium]
MIARSKWYKIALALAVVLGLVVSFVHQAGAQQIELPQEAEQSEQEATLKVGTYNAEAVFQSHPGHARLMNAVQEAQQQVEGADQQTRAQIQQQISQQQAQIIQQFQSDVQEALPEAAEAADVKVVAVEIAYTAEDVETVDVSEHLIKAFEGAAAEEGEQSPRPQQRPQLPRR